MTLSDSAEHATNPTLLLADDDKAFCAALRGAFARRGYRVVISHNHDDALAEAEVWQPEKAVIDLRMPGKNGLELVAALKRRWPDLTVVVLTGYGSIATAVEAMKLGASHYLTKPSNVEEILAAFHVDRNSSVEPPSDPMPLDDVQWEHLQKVLAESGGNISEAARRLGMHRRTLQRKLARARPGRQ